MKYKYLFFVFLLFSINSRAQSDSELIKKLRFTQKNLIINKDTIKFIYSNVIENRKKPTIIFVQGSLPLPIIYQKPNEVFINVPFNYDKYVEKFNIVLISRKGIPLVASFDMYKDGYLDSKGRVPSLYNLNNNLNYRTFQVKNVIDFLYKQKWVQKDSIFLIGHSEGYRVVSKVAEHNLKISKLVCMSADPFNRIAEDMTKERLNCFLLNNDSLSQLRIQKLIEDYKHIQKLNIEKYKSNIGEYNWASYNSEMPYKNLQKFKNPILIVYGTDDICSFHSDLLPFILQKDNLSIKAYSNYDHNFIKKEFDKAGISIDESYHWDEVFKDVIDWILK